MKQEDIQLIDAARVSRKTYEKIYGPPDLKEVAELAAEHGPDIGTHSMPKNLLTRLMNERPEEVKKRMA